MKTKLDFISTVFSVCLLQLVLTLPSYAQSEIDHANSKHIVMVNNKTNNPIKELYVGDKVRLKLTKASKVRGTIMSIDSVSFVVSNRRVCFDEIIKISTRKSWVQVVGGALIVSGWAISFDGAADAYINQLVYEENSGGEQAFLGMAMVGAGVAMVLPAYHDLGKFSLMVISSKPNDITQSIVKN